jgi:hypothetical protein
MSHLVQEGPELSPGELHAAGITAAGLTRGTQVAQQAQERLLVAATCGGQDTSGTLLAPPPFSQYVCKSEAVKSRACNESMWS